MIPPSTRLRRAILLNEPLLVARLIRSNPLLIQNPDFSSKSNTSLHLAAHHNRPLIIPLLLAAGHESSEISRNTDNATPLHLAAKAGNVECAELLVAHDPRCIPMSDNLGMDAMALASQNPASTALIPILLSDDTYPASPESRDNNGNTPLHHASAAGSLKALRILVSAGANPLAKNNYDWTPLAYSQTVAAEVYCKNLVAEFERHRVEGARAGEERERARLAGVRLVEEEGVEVADKRSWDAGRRPGTPRGEGWTSAASVRMRAGSGE